MKANELRIGNWVLEESYNNEYIESMVDSGAYIDSQIKYIKPIPLTEEWLVKFGFNKSNNYTLNDLQICTYTMLKDEDLIYMHDVIIADEIKTVHRLQNLYFALTGEELEIKQNVIKNV